MDLLEESMKKKGGKPKEQKLVLTLLIVAIILFVLVAIMKTVLKGEGSQEKYSIAINGSIVPTESLGLLETEDGNKYVSIKELSKNLGFEYYNGEYKTNGEVKSKGYINNGINIIQFFTNSKEIFKTEEGSEKDYEYYQLSNEIVMANDSLYINVNDLTLGFNVLVSYSDKMNQTIIMTTEYWKTQNTEKFEEAGIEISELPENDKALSYGYVITKNKKFGIINLLGEEIIGSKYESISFSEYTNEFIVSNSNGKYGSIDTQGNTKIELQYDSLEIIQYKPLLYKVEHAGNFGVLKEDGSLLNDISYSNIGYPANIANNIYYTLIIPELNENIPTSIVVCKDELYGLIDLETGEEIVPCSLKGIFLFIDVEKDLKEYVVELEEGGINTLENYVNSLNQITARINDEKQN